MIKLQLFLAFMSILSLCYCFLFLATVKADLESLSDLRLVEIMANPSGTDSKENEYLKFANYTNSEISLKNYKVCNISNDCYIFPDSSIIRDCLTVFRKEFLFTLHNDHESISLFDPLGNLIQYVSFGSSPSEKAWTCSKSKCDWAPAQTSCDYENIYYPDPIEENKDLPAETVNNNDNLSEESDSEENDPSVQNKNSNSSGKDEGKIFKIDSERALNEAAELAKKKGAAIKVNMEGEIIIPLGILGKTNFYLASFHKWVKVKIYSSFYNSNQNLSQEAIDNFLSRNTQIKIEDANLISSNGYVSLNLVKNTKINEENRKTKRKKAKKNFKVSELKKMHGDLVSFKGKILSKTGDYFYIERSDSKVITVFIPKEVLNTFLEKKSILNKNKDKFPSYKAEKEPQINYEGAEIKSSGIVESDGISYRIIITSWKDISMSFPQKIDNSAKKEEGSKIGPANSNSNNHILKEKNNSREISPNSPGPSKENVEKKSEIEKLSEKYLLSPKTVDSKNQIKSLISQKLSWIDLIEVLMKKFGRIFSG